MEKKEIKEKLNKFKNENEKKIKEALEQKLEKFLQKFPFRNNPQEIDKLTPEKIYEKSSGDTFLHWIEYELKSLGAIGQASKEYAENAKKDYEKFKSLLREALTPASLEDKPLSKRIDLPWEEIPQWGGNKIVAKKIIFCYYPDEIVPIFNTKHAEKVAKKFGINYKEEAEKRYKKNYKKLSTGEKSELLNELFMEYKEKELGLKRNRFDNVLFAHFIYENEELDPRKTEKTSEISDKTKSEASPLLEEILNALKSKPFLILAGISGTGKTQIARLVAEKWDNTNEINNFIDENLILKQEIPSTSPERVAFLPVRPDWNEPRKMWGYYNPLTGLFYPTDGLKVLLNAFRDYVTNKDNAKKHFIILDEMNLARVEYYMSDLLSLMENMCKNEDNKIIIGETAMIHQLSRCVLSKLPEEYKKEWEKYIKEENGEIKWKIEGEKLCMEKCDNCPYKALKENKKEQTTTKEMKDFIDAFSPIPPRIAYPPNLVIIGTVNVDETTFSFAPKVLDRAWVKEFNEVKVEEYLKTCTDLNDKNKEGNMFFKFIDNLVKILQPANLHFGYRVIHEMLKYFCAAGLVKEEEKEEKEKEDEKEKKKFKISDLKEDKKLNFHFDFLLLSKILPKIHGGEEKVEEILRKLLAYCYDDNYEDGAKKLEESKEMWWRKKAEEIKEILKKEEKISSENVPATASEEESQQISTENKESTEKKQTISLRFPSSAKKILEMYRRLKDTGYCSYF